MFGCFAKIYKYNPSIGVHLPLYVYENYDIAYAMSSSRADPVLGHCPNWGYLNI